MKNLNFPLLLLVFLALSCSKDDMMNSGDKNDRYADASLKSAGPVFEVADLSDDDTEALLDAFALAQAAGKGAVVELQEGTFEIGMIEVREFSGTLTGLGRENTIITNLEDITPDAALAANKLPALLRFIGGELRVSDLTVKVSEISAWPATVGLNMLLFSDYTADFLPTKKHIGVTVENVEIIGLPDGVDPYTNFNGVMLAPDKQYEDYPIPRSNIDASVSNSSFSNLLHGIYAHGCRSGNFKFGMEGGNVFTSTNRAGIAVNENIGVHVKILNNEFTTHHGVALDINTGEEAYIGYKQFEDVNVEPGTYDIWDNTFNISSAGGFGMMDTWRMVHPDNLVWMKVSIMKNTFILENFALLGDLYCLKNLTFKDNTVLGDETTKYMFVENFWWDWDGVLPNNYSESCIFQNNYFLTPIEFWFWLSKDCKLMGDLSNLTLYDFGENTQIMGKTNYGHSNEKFLEQAKARKERLMEMFQR
jgi:hypothetical protein